jgi:hypothetical protein
MAVPIWIGLAIVAVAAWLKKILNVGWEAVWAEVFKEIFNAEEKFQAGEGKLKKDFVLETVVAWIEAQTSLPIYVKVMLKLVIGFFVDGWVTWLNDWLGTHEWLPIAEEAKATFEGWMSHLRSLPEKESTTG